MKTKSLLLTVFCFSFFLGYSGISMNANQPDKDKTTPSEKVTPKCYLNVIDTAYYTDFKDCDNDGYASWRLLVIEFDEAPPSEEAYLEIWFEVDKEYYFLAKTEMLSFPHDPVELKIQGLKHLYGRTIIIVKDVGIGEDVDNHYTEFYTKLESKDNDQQAEIAHCKWSDHNYVDADGDGYFSQRQLEIDISSCYSDVPMYYGVSVRKQPVSGGPCWLYKSPSFITDTLSGFLSAMIGGENWELTKGEYSIDVQVFSANTHAPVSDVHNCDEFAKFESPEDDKAPDVQFSIGNVHMGDNEIDLDFDRYNRSRDLYFNATANTGMFELTAKLFYRENSEVEFSHYHTTLPFVVSTSGSELQQIMIGAENPELDHAFYDLKIQLCLGSTVVAEILPEEEQDLSMQAFETSPQDAPFKINNVSWSVVNDWDGDGYASYRELCVVFDAYAEVEPVYLVLISTSNGTEQNIFTSEVFMPSESDPVYKFGIPGEMVIDGTGTVYLYRDSDGELINSMNSLDTRFETPEDDMVYSIGPAKWTESVDYDRDGYFSSRTLALNIQAAPLNRTLKIKVSLCPETAEDKPCSYGDELYFKADSSVENMIYIKLGLPNAELDSAIYQLDICVVDSATGEVVIDYSTVKDNIPLEPLAQDKFVFFFTEIRMSDERIDTDNDRYNASRNLLFDVDVTGGTHRVYARLYYRIVGETDFMEYTTTKSFEVSPGVVKFESITIGYPDMELDHNEYDFKLVIFKSDNNEEAVVALPENVRDLNDQWFETILQDAPAASEALTVEKFKSEDIIVYPNPFDNSFTLSLESFSNEESVIIRLLDTRGRLLTEMKFEPCIGKKYTEIDNLEGISPGIYILEIVSPGARGQLLLVKR